MHTNRNYILVRLILLTNNIIVYNLFIYSKYNVILYGNK